MNHMMRLNIEKAQQFIEGMKETYDFVRIVEPGECRVLSLEDGGAPGADCYAIWKSSHRCSNCTSYQACMTEDIREKDEILDDQVCHVISLPVLLECPNNLTRRATIEMVNFGVKEEAPGAARPAESFESHAIYRWEERTSLVQDLSEDFEKNRQLGMDSWPELTHRILSAAALNMDAGVVCFSTERKCIFANTRAFRMFHIEPDLARLEDILNPWTEQLGPREPGTIWGQIYCYGKEESLYNVQYIRVADQSGKILGDYYAIYDRTPGIQAFREQFYRATHDHLTGIYNGPYFLQRVRAALDEEPDVKRVMVMSDIWDFKLVNQLFGVEKGDEILVGVARTMDRECGKDTIYGRYEADKFVFCIPMERFDEERIRGIILEMSHRLVRSYKLHFRMGVYNITDPSMDVGVMCERAKIAIGSASREEECGIHWFDDTMLMKSLIEQRILSGFREALEKKQFKMYLQPQISVNGSLVGMEALIRWHHPIRGIMNPGEFLPILERNDLVSDLDRYIWEEAARQLQRWKGTEKENLYISVNILPSDLFFFDVESIFAGLVEKYEIRPELLRLEITETAVIADPRECARFVSRMNSRGFHVEIDDFGSGYSALNMLKDINASALKIDMEFLRDADNVERSRTIVKLVINLAKTLKMNVICEGVETKGQFEFLRASGCDVCQGYYFSEPLTVEEFEKKY